MQSTTLLLDVIAKADDAIRKEEVRLFLFPMIFRKPNRLYYAHLIFLWLRQHNFRRSYRNALSDWVCADAYLLIF